MESVCAIHVFSERGFFMGFMDVAAAAFKRDAALKIYSSVHLFAEKCAVIFELYLKARSLYYVSC